MFLNFEIDNTTALNTTTRLAANEWPLDSDWTLERLLTAAIDEADQLEHFYAGTEHLLLALTREEMHRARWFLSQLGLDPAEIRDEVFAILGRGR